MMNASVVCKGLSGLFQMFTLLTDKLLVLSKRGGRLSSDLAVQYWLQRLLLIGKLNADINFTSTRNEGKDIP